MRKSTSSKAPVRESAMNQQAEQLEVWEGEGGTTGSAESGRTDSGGQWADSALGSLKRSQR
jgi:hypothetical protein